MLFQVNVKVIVETVFKDQVEIVRSLFIVQKRDYVRMLYHCKDLEFLPYPL